MPALLQPNGGIDDQPFRAADAEIRVEEDDVVQPGRGWGSGLRSGLWLRFGVGFGLGFGVGLRLGSGLGLGLRHGGRMYDGRDGGAASDIGRIAARR